MSTTLEQTRTDTYERASAAWARNPFPKFTAKWHAFAGYCENIYCDDESLDVYADESIEQMVACATNYAEDEWKSYEA